MKNKKISFKSYAWSLGTTSFRTKNFNYVIETQLSLLDEFWKKSENINQNWSSNKILQEKYYDFMKSKKFITGAAKRKAKDAREKTSGLVSLGLIDSERRLTEVGYELLNISNSNDFNSNNEFLLPKDSYIYFKQLLKTSVSINNDIVKPFIVLIKFLSEFDYLTKDEFTYLLPLCINKDITIKIINDLQDIRNNIPNKSVDNTIINVFMSMDNYQNALDKLQDKSIQEQFSNDIIDENLFSEIGMNRKSRKLDKKYYPIYQSLKKICFDDDNNEIIELFENVDKLNQKKLWKKYLFGKSTWKQVKSSPKKHFNNSNIITSSKNILEFNKNFFETLHLFKVKLTLEDYFDLNKRYFKLSDCVIFEDNKIHLDIIPKHFFKNISEELFKDAFERTSISSLKSNCNFTDIHKSLVFNKNTIINGINLEFGTSIKNMEEARKVVQDERYKRFNDLIDTKFTNETLITLLNDFETRNDNNIYKLVTDNADVPTIFEYIIGIIWYKISERKGKILDYMHLSLEADLLPKTHASGGEADIEYYYDKCIDYPEHYLLIEVTLADGTNQRRMEMEPVSRHLGEHILKHENNSSYCIFGTTHLDRNVISDFRNRKTYQYYNKDCSKMVDGLKIIPLQTKELKTILYNKLTYKQLYDIFDNAFKSNESIPNWYEKEIINTIGAN